LNDFWKKRNIEKPKLNLNELIEKNFPNERLLKVDEKELYNLKQNLRRNIHQEKKKQIVVEYEIILEKFFKNYQFKSEKQSQQLKSLTRWFNNYSQKHKADDNQKSYLNEWFQTKCSKKDSSKLNETQINNIKSETRIKVKSTIYEDKREKYLSKRREYEKKYRAKKDEDKREKYLAKRREREKKYRAKKKEDQKKAKILKNDSNEVKSQEKSQNSSPINYKLMAENSCDLPNELLENQESNSQSQSPKFFSDHKSSGFCSCSICKNPGPSHQF
jgi:hypothetical protein